MGDDAGETEEDKTIVRIDPDLKDLIPGYLENRRKDIESIKAAVGNEDFELVFRLGHSMKGSGAGYGFGTVSRLGALIEKAGKAADAEAILEALTQLVRYLDRVDIVYE